MAERFPLFFTPIDLPAQCFLSEAVEWLAFGRVPEADWLYDGPDDTPYDARFGWRDMPDNFVPRWEHPWFSISEFESLNIQVDDEYFAAAKLCDDADASSLQNTISEYRNKRPAIVEDESGKDINIWEKAANEYQLKLDDLAPQIALVEKTEAHFVRHAEVAWSKLFQLIQSGQISVEAINFDEWERLVDEDNYESAGKPTTLNGAEIPLDYDYKQNEIEIGTTKFVALRVSVFDLLTLGPAIFPKGRTMTVQRFGQSISTVESYNKPRKKGRPRTLDWGALQERLDWMVREGNVPDGKESCIYELIAYAEKKWGRSPSRSSVQRQLGEALDAIFANNAQ